MGAPALNCSQSPLQTLCTEKWMILFHFSWEELKERRPLCAATCCLQTFFFAENCMVLKASWGQCCATDLWKWERLTAADSCTGCWAGSVNHSLWTRVRLSCKNHLQCFQPSTWRLSKHLGINDNWSCWEMNTASYSFLQLNTNCFLLFCLGLQR